MSKQTITVAPFQHRGANWIKVSSHLTTQQQILIKEINGRKWSQTHKCWYIPYTKEAFAALKARFTIENKKTLAEPRQKEQIAFVATNKVTSRTHIRLTVENNTRIKAYVPYDKKGWIEIIRNVPGRAWNVKNKILELTQCESHIQNSEKRNWNVQSKYSVQNRCKYS